MAISRIKLPRVPNEGGVVTICTVLYVNSLLPLTLHPQFGRWWLIIFTPNQDSTAPGQDVTIFWDGLVFDSCRNMKSEDIVAI